MANESRNGKWRWYIGLAVVYLACGLAPQGAQAGDLDNGYEFWNVTWRLLGRDSTSMFTEDTLPNGALQLAVNAGIRQVATDIGVTGHQRITVVAETFRYALTNTFIENGLPGMPIQVRRITADGSGVRGMVRGSAEQFGSQVLASGISMWDLSGDTLWIDDADNDGDIIYLEGPIEGTVITNGAGTTNIYDIDRMAVCYWAAYIYGLGVAHPNTDRFLAAYISHVQKRGGVPPQAGVQ